MCCLKVVADSKGTFHRHSVTVGITKADRYRKEQTMNNFVIVLSAALAVATASDVLEFTDSNFAKKVASYPVILVEFYAPWCGHCKKLAPEYEIAATALLNEEPPVPLAKVDCTAETETCSKYGVSGYPTLKIFKNGEVAKDYNGGRDSDGIISTMKKESGPVSKELTDVDKANSFLSKPSVGVVGFFESEESDNFKAYKKVADKLEKLRFAHVFDKDVKKSLGQTEGVVLYRPDVMKNKFEESNVHTTETNTEKLADFLQKESLGLCAERTISNAQNFGKPLFVTYFNVDYKLDPKGSNYWRNRVMKVAKKLKDEGITAYYGVSNANALAMELTECGNQDKFKKTPVVCGFDEKGLKYPMAEEFSMDVFEQFVRDVLDGKAEAYVKSEPIPENNDAPVKVVVAKNFDEIVNNEEKDVLIEFYAPWCGHCKSLAPKYDELAEKLSGESGITIAKMDATANDVPPNYQVQGFPTIYFAPKGNKTKPKKYEGGREVEDFMRYLAKESTDGLSSYTKEGKKKKTKKAKKEEL